MHTIPISVSDNKKPLQWFQMLSPITIHCEATFWISASDVLKWKFSNSYIVSIFSILSLRFWVETKNIDCLKDMMSVHRTISVANKESINHTENEVDAARIIIETQIAAKKSQVQSSRDQVWQRQPSSPRNDHFGPVATSLPCPRLLGCSWLWTTWTSRQVLIVVVVVVVVVWPWRLGGMIYWSSIMGHTCLWTDCAQCYVQ